MKFNTGFDLKHLRGDLFGGITAGIVALPLALAFGAQTEFGAIAGLYGAIALGFFAALLGGTPVQISGPTAPMTVVSAVIMEYTPSQRRLGPPGPMLPATAASSNSTTVPVPISCSTAPNFSVTRRALLPAAAISFGSARWRMRRLG